MSGAGRRPPRIARWLLGRFVAPAEREFVLGDLDEEFSRMPDVAAARSWYRSQAIRSAAAALRDRFSPRGAGLAPESRRTGSMDRFVADIRFAVRSLRRTPALAALVIATLAAGSGATIAIFTAANEVLFRALAYDDPDELVMLWESNRERGWDQVEAAPANVADWRDRVNAFEDIAHYSPFPRGVALVQSDAAHHVSVGAVSGNLFDVLGVRAAMGRVFTDEETWADAEPVVILGHAAWQRYYNGDAGILGRTIDLDGTSYTVIGVMPQWFEYDFSDAEMWTTMRWNPSLASAVWFRQAHVVRAVARLRDGATVEQARAELAAVGRQLEEEHPDLNAGMEPGLTPLKAFMVKDERTPLMLLLGAVGLLMLIAVANVANLLLVRSSGRVREIAVRASLGASRRRVVQQLLTESGLLAAAGTAAGLMVAWLALRLVRTFGGEGLPPLDLVPDGRLVAFVVALGAGSAVLFGLAPALRASRVDLRGTLAESSRTGTPGRRRADSSNVIVMAQVALAVMLAAAAGLTFRSLSGLGAVADDVPTENILTFQVAPPSGSYDDAGRARFAIELNRRLSTMPGVRDAGVGRGFPLAGYAWSSDFKIRGWPADRFGTDVRHREALPGYFSTLGVAVLEGEMFPEVPAPDRQVPVVVNRAFVERYFPDSSPVGQFIANDREPTENSYWYEIVAVVENERKAVHEEPVPEIISHIFGDVPGTLSVVMRTEVEPLSMVDAVRGAVRELDPGVPLMNVRTMEAIRDASLARERLMFTVFGVLAFCALILACVGIYGVASQAARARQREVGIRVALGATRGRIVRQFVGSGIGWIGAGLVLGIAGALSAGRVVETLLWGVTPSDATTLVVVSAVLATSGLLASFIPARRASLREPVAVLREEG